MRILELYNLQSRAVNGFMGKTLESLLPLTVTPPKSNVFPLQRKSKLLYYQIQALTIFRRKTMTPIVTSQTPYTTGFTPVPTRDPALKNESAKAIADGGGGGEPTSESNADPLEKATEKSDQAQAIGLTEGELKLVQALKSSDTEVRAHEMAHMAAGGQYVTSGARFEYTRGPDGINYAVAGEVSIDTSPIPGDPQATMDKMDRIKAAALAPASPSSQDRKVAANAAATSASAAGELMMLRTAEGTGSTTQAAGTTGKDAAAAYADTAEEEKQPGTLLDIAA